MKTKLLLSAFLLCSALISYGQWSYTNLSQAKVRMGSTSLGTKAYFAGGDNNINFFTLVEIYDVVDGTWTYGNLSLAREFPIGVSCGSKVFFAGGANLGTNTVYNIVDIYDTLTQQWTVEYLSAPRFSISAVAKGNKVLFAGGINLATNQASAIVDIYDIENGLWTTATLSKARGSMGAAVIGDQAFFAGGYDLINYTNRVDIYNFSTGIWSTATLSQARGFLSAASVGNKVLFAGGMTDPATGTSASNRVDIYNTLTGNWTTASLSSSRAFFDYATKVNNTIYFAGGGAFIGNQGGWSTSSNIIDIYNDATGTWSVDHLSHDLINHSVTSAGNSLLVAGGYSCSLNSIFSKVEIYRDPTLIHIPADYPTIQQGIDAATPGDTVLVAEGTYNEQINFKGKKPLMVSSQFLLDGNVSHIDSTIIEKSTFPNSDSASLVYFVSGEDTTSVLCGFTIRHGKGTVYASPGNTYREGGAIFISSSGAKVLHNHITENHLNNTLLGHTDYVSGAGIGCELKSDPHWVVISDNIIDHNSCTSNNLGAEGAGIRLSYNSRITGNTLNSNTCTGLGSAYAVGAAFSCGLDVTTLTNVTAIVSDNLISNNVVTAADNFAHSAAGAFLIAKGVFSNNIVENNETVTVPGYGGGCAIVYWNPKEGCIVRNNTFRGNTSNNLGCLASETPDTYPNPKTILIENNYFIDNYAIWGGAIYLLRTHAIIQNNVFSGNNSTQKGGAVYYAPNTGVVSTEHKVTFINNSFFGNKSYMGGAIYAYSYTVKPLIINSVFWGDTAVFGSEIYLEYSSDTAEIANSNINLASIYGRFRDGGGNINTDPFFTDTDSLFTQVTSPVIDAGTAAYTCANGAAYTAPQFDLLGLPRPWGTSPVDIGAYEYTDFSGIHKKVAKSIVIFPNPFTNAVTISYTTDKTGPVLLQIFDNYGRLVAEPVNSFQPQGEQKIEWNGGNLPAGIYFIRLQTGKNLITEKIVKMH